MFLISEYKNAIVEVDDKDTIRINRFKELGYTDYEPEKKSATEKAAAKKPAAKKPAAEKAAAEQAQTN